MIKTNNVDTVAVPNTITKSRIANVIPIIAVIFKNTTTNSKWQT